MKVRIKVTDWVAKLPGIQSLVQPRAMAHPVPHSEQAEAACKKRWEKLSERDDLIGVLARNSGIVSGDENDPLLAPDQVKRAMMKAKNEGHPVDLDTLRTEKGETIAHLAAELGLPGVLEHVLKSKPALANAVDQDKKSPLHGAVDLLAGDSLGHHRSIALLLKSRANPNHADKNGTTPLHQLMRNQERLSAYGLELTPEHTGFLAASAQALIKAKANVNAVDSKNATPLYDCIGNFYDVAVAQVLLANGADPFIPAYRAETAPLSTKKATGLNTVELSEYLNYPQRGQLLEFIKEYTSNAELKVKPGTTDQRGLFNLVELGGTIKR